jgi:hypothetical protein
VTLSLCLAAASGVATLSGCRVTENDVHRWETTEFGPLKLGAVVKHDKYPMPLRLESGMALIRMKPRAGRRVGIEKLTDSLRDMQPDDRKKVVNGLVPMIIAQMDRPLPVQQGLAPEERKGPDPSIPFKDTAYALLNNDKANLVTDDAMRKALQDALVRWATADFDRRITITSQLYGLEQIFRTLGTESVKSLPPLIKPDSTYDRISSLVAELGDQATKDATAKKLVELAQYTEGAAWVAKVKPLIDEANKKGGYNVPEDKLNKQVAEYQDEQVIKIYASMKKVGGRAAVDYLLGVAQNEERPVKRRQAAMAALEGRLDRNNPADAAAVMKVASAEKTPDEVRDLAFARASELSREAVIDKLYALFDTTKEKDPKRWKVRWVAASTVLKMSQAKDVPGFFAKLPPNPAVGFAMGEALENGAGIGKIKPPPTNEQMAAELKSPQLANKLTALGFFQATGKAAEIPLVHALAEDRTPLPKTEDPEAKWQWQVPKAGGTAGQTEAKELTTVGDFVKIVVEPTMAARK